MERVVHLRNSVIQLILTERLDLNYNTTISSASKFARDRLHLRVDDVEEFLTQLSEIPISEPLYLQIYTEQLDVVGLATTSSSPRPSFDFTDQNCSSFRSSGRKLLELWRVYFEPASSMPLTKIMSFNKPILLTRAIYAYIRLMPCSKLYRQGKSKSTVNYLSPGKPCSGGNSTGPHPVKLFYGLYTPKTQSNAILKFSGDYQEYNFARLPCGIGDFLVSVQFLPTIPLPRLTTPSNFVV